MSWHGHERVKGQGQVMHLSYPQTRKKEMQIDELTPFVLQGHPRGPCSLKKMKIKSFFCWEGGVGGGKVRNGVKTPSPQTFRRRKESLVGTSKNFSD